MLHALLDNPKLIFSTYKPNVFINTISLLLLLLLLYTIFFYYSLTLVMVSRIKTIYPYLKFHVGSGVRQETPEEGQKMHRPKCCEYNHRDKDNSSTTVNDKNVGVNINNFDLVFPSNFIDELLHYNFFHGLWVKKQTNKQTKNTHTILFVCCCCFFFFILLHAKLCLVILLSSAVEEWRTTLL